MPEQTAASSAAAEPDRATSVLVLEYGFMIPRRGKPVHGAELFRIDLIRDLVRFGVRVTVPCEREWAARLEPLGEPPNLRVIPMRGALKVIGGGIKAALAARRDAPYDVVIFGNPGKGLIPGVRLTHALSLGRRYLLFVDRVPPTAVRRALRRLPLTVIANSDLVADYYRSAGLPSRVLYGLHRSELFYPRQTPKPAEAPVKFCLVARLPGIDKGLEVALEAFSRLPDDVRTRSELHLVAFENPPTYDDPNVVAHPWMPYEKVPELLREMDAQLALSSHETFSHSIVQGMMTALPVIATPIPVYLDKLSPDRGGAGGVVVSRVDAADEVAREMERLARDPDLRARLGRQGREVAERKFVWDTRRFLDEVLAETPPAEATLP